MRFEAEQPAPRLHHSPITALPRKPSCALLLYLAEAVAKKVCGSEGALGNGYNDINLQYGNWNIIVMPNWQTDDDRVMIMSSEANKNLSGNMFFNRVPLTVSNWVDHHTGNYIWGGRCRFGVGFGTYKHILLAVDSASAVSEASAL